MCEDTVMKLFSQLLVAPAALGLLVPLSTNASEVNISEIASYSDIDLVEEEEIFDHNSFKNSLVKNSTIEANVSPVTFEAGGFSDTTVASQTAQFLLSAADGAASMSDEESVQFNYYYSISLDTSFNGEDNLNVGIEAGNTGNNGAYTGTILDFGTTAGDTFSVVDINYTRTFGDLTVQLGDSLDASSQFSGACAYSGFTDQLADCGTGLSAGLGGDVTVSTSYDIGNGFVAGFGITGAEGSTTDGLFSKESVDAYAAQIAYADDSYGLSVSYSNIDTGTDSSDDASALIGVGSDHTIWGINGYYTFGGVIENLSVGYEMANPSSGKDTTNWFAGLTTGEVGPGTIGIGVGSTGHTDGDTAEQIMYEVSYNWNVNDATSMTAGAFIKEQPDVSGAAVDDITGVALITTFSF